MSDANHSTDHADAGTPGVGTWCLVLPLMIFPVREIASGSSDVLVYIPVIAAVVAAIIQLTMVIRRRRDAA
ncbi:hypothetical protein ACN93_10160 [Gordonia paraffinivorans]|uniref:hypothetical protein n=1 Tax=Gordonia paraffinivorans TaxID=175628 RepID=UPI000D61592E|nr:hypothetical protein [Gordonia paraffinivorans]PWD43203.1 hypothetical protein ACN93_10160 [Gordonia paraffinivorans]